MLLKDITPKGLECVVGACPAIFESDRGTYFLVGRMVGGDLPKELEGRVGEDETVVEIPMGLLAVVHPKIGK